MSKRKGLKNNPNFGTPAQIASAKAARAAFTEQTIDREWIFFLEWRRTHNKAKAALRAGYCADNPAMASSMGNQILHRPRVWAWVEEYKKEIEEKYNVTNESLVNEVRKLAYSGMADYTVINEDGELLHDFTGLTEEQMAAIQEITVESYEDKSVTDSKGNPVKVKKVKFKLYDKAKAAELLMRHRKMLNGTLEVNGVDGQPLELPQINVVFRDPIKKE